MRTLHVALVTNALGPPTRGNGTTVHRWLGWLPDVNVHVTPLYPGFDVPPGRTPDIIHGYHALHGGRHAAELAATYDLPLVISLGGTDIYDLKRDAACAADVRRVLDAATLITGAFPSFGEELGALGAGPDAYAVVPRGVHIPDPTPPPPTDTLAILLPAGIRPVKDPLLALTLLAKLRASDIPARLTIAGPVLDEDYDRQFQAELAKHPHATWIDVPRSEMPAHYAAAHTVWNTSLHEGGANALLEGLAFGTTVYARNVPGNRDLLVPDAPGRLFDEASNDLIGFHESVLRETSARRADRIAYTRLWLQAKHDSGAEARALRAAYERALG